jgi:hypothetical protein
VQIARPEQEGQRAVLLLYRTPTHFGGVRGKHELDAKFCHRLTDLLGRYTRRSETPKAVLQRSPLWRGLFGLILASSPNAVLLLRDIGQIQKVREGTRHPVGISHRHAPDQRLQPVTRGLLSSARRLCQSAYLLDQSVQVLALVQTQYFAQKLSQHLDIG